MDASYYKKSLQKAPFAIGIASNNVFFHSYKSGIVDSTECGLKVNHTVLLVGYGTADGINYWLIKNSWNETWGDNGYIKVAMDSQLGSTGICGIQIYSTLVTTN